MNYDIYLIFNFIKLKTWIEINNLYNNKAINLVMIILIIYYN